MMDIHESHQMLDGNPSLCKACSACTCCSNPDILSEPCQGRPE